MTLTYVLVMSLGPVQDFIAQARRTRDLWFGSHVLSALSLAAALAARQLGARLLIPSRVEGADAAPNVPNKLLMLVHGGDPREVARAAREAARDYLCKWCEDIWRQRSSLVDPDSLETAREQWTTLLEFHAAWSPFVSPDGYAAALQTAEAALAERKRLRPFAQWTHQRGGRHKSSLDGARESVLRRGPRERGNWSHYRIGLREELDAIGLLKRTGGEPEQFVPVPTIGLAAYTQRAQATRAPLMSKLRDACERLRERKVLTAVRPKGISWVKTFPFDAQLLLPGRWSTHLEEQDLPAQEAADFGRDFVQPVLSKLGEPYPYVACLVADGDNMGKALQGLARRGPEAHQKFSEALSGFATEARRIFQEREHRGALVYAGGDDVLGFVCLPDALACATELSRAFTAAMARGLEGETVERPTLSVGIGVGHVLESMGELLSLGRRAEQLAKGEDRDGLALLARLHSSRELSWRGRWSDTPAPVPLLEASVGLLEDGTLPLSKVREVRAALRRVPRKVSKQDEARWRPVALGEVRRVLARVEAGSAGAGLTPEGAGLVLDENASLEVLHAQVERWVERVLLAEMFSRAKPGRRADTGGAA